MVGTPWAMIRACDVTVHVHCWKPAMHDLTCLHFLGVGESSSNTVNRDPIDGVVHFVCPRVLLLHVVADGAVSASVIESLLHSGSDPSAFNF